MKQVKKQKTIKFKLHKLLIFIAIITSLILIYNISKLGPIEPFIRLTIILFILTLNVTLIKRKNTKNNKRYILIATLLIIFNMILSYGLNKIYNLVEKINKQEIIYSTVLIAKNEKDLENINDIVNQRIGIINDTTSIDNYVLAAEIIKNNNLEEDNEIIKYNDLPDMLYDLYQNKIDCIFISSNYKTMFQSIDEYQNIDKETKVLTTSEKTVKKENSIDYINSEGKNVTESFTILLMGVDSEKDGIIKNASNGDSLILISFNPTTLNTTMLSIPRDSYVPITCFQDKRENKITHAGWYGSGCMIDTIENLLEIKIDYYVKINFKGVVSLVNKLGGVTVDVPKELCTDNSNREEKICIKKGIQTLNGEEALVLARNRYDLARGDLDRANNQQLLIKAILEKAKNIDNVLQVETILETVSKNIDTNMTNKQILSFYNIAKDIIKIGINNEENIIPIEKLELLGDGQMIYDSQSKLTLWNYILNKESINDVKEAIKKNLENDILNTNFNYSVNEHYSNKIVGSGPYKTNSKYVLLPSFIGNNKGTVEKFAKKHNIKVEYIYEKQENSKYENGKIINQNYPKNTRIDKISTLKISILENKPKLKFNCSNIENKNEVCYLPSFIGKTKEEIEKHFMQYSNNIEIIYNEALSSLYPQKKIGTIVGQNYKINTHLSAIDKIEFTIVSE